MSSLELEAGKLELIREIVNINSSLHWRASENI